MSKPKFVSLKGFLSFEILHLLSKKRFCGDELAVLIGEKKLGKLTPGTIYPALKTLRKNKLIYYNQEGRKKIYKLTRKGNEEYKTVKKNFRKIYRDIFK